ncbi:MAG: Membrane protein [Candidatus Magasanikbacteria bacterium GW2011_GWC2_34_16]|uniref:Membrane protein n=2 Tax=Candidatus Magasanikiibacteriota TaxID=1752731 RepID=A0A0G0HEU7_9BACT|nr:MAG: Membrane protein [Candidatus Magasanikbacteria bacterium GW2011_GWC2_34_16]KKQ40722.1 MAG: Membrane protein [Candidatus Magasanikbacteria bacterium GW2011_GWA2_37_8]
MLYYGMGFGFGMIVFAVWSIFWKGWAMWIAARQGQKVWFGALLVVNTLGILEILYIFIFSKSQTKDAVAPIVQAEVSKKETEKVE